MRGGESLALCGLYYHSFPFKSEIKPAVLLVLAPLFAAVI